MRIIAQLAPWERRRPLVLITLCAMFALWFAWDGWYGWPNHDNVIVKHMLVSDHVTEANKTIARSWPGWWRATEAQRLKFDHLVYSNNITGWHTVTDIHNQRWIVLALSLVALAGVIWFLRVKSRSIVADDHGIHLSGGRFIAFSQIIRIDNRRWPDAGLVTIESTDSSGRHHHAVLDSVIFDNLPPLLNEVIARATSAEVINPAAKPSAVAGANTTGT